MSSMMEGFFLVFKRNYKNVVSTNFCFKHTPYVFFSRWVFIFASDNMRAKKLFPAQVSWCVITVLLYRRVIHFASRNKLLYLHCN